MKNSAERMDRGSEKLELLAQNLIPELQRLKSEKNYTSYILIGAGAVEFLLEKLFIAYVHLFNANSLSIEIALNDGFPQELHIKPPSTSGRILKALKEHFRFHDYHSATYDKLRELIDTRNEIAHELIDKYDGDIRKLNESLKPYAESDPVETCSNLIIDAINEIINSITSRMTSEQVQKNLQDE